LVWHGEHLSGSRGTRKAERLGFAVG
jgi:hypothetical protein